MWVVLIVMTLLAPMGSLAICHHDEKTLETAVATDPAATAELKMLQESGVVNKNNGCQGSACTDTSNPCCSGCHCLPVGIVVGVCYGGCSQD
ncbi:hypothetical protein ACFX13_041870 [Malus domestica]|uniref:Uncharacterized protein n=2 Tax=Malus TaxID=3749 RepID=A0A498JK39_MALDO|nr:hypothetical protein DVH24_023978 [Malus domestica]